MLVIVVVMVVLVVTRSADGGQPQDALPMVAVWISGSTGGYRWGHRMGLSADAMVVVSWLPAAARPRRVPGSQQRRSEPC